MVVLLMEGRLPAAALRAEIRRRTAALADQGVVPHLAAVLVGEDRASELYLRRKEKIGRDLGITVEPYRLKETSVEGLKGLLHRLSLRSDVDGILVEQPLPRSVPRAQVLSAIAPAKDVDGVTGQSSGLLTGVMTTPVPATAQAVMRLLHYYRINLRGAHMVIVGHSPVVGKPLALLALQQDATVTVCHKETRDLAAHTRQADILVVATGVPGLITGDMVRPGATVVDVGINVVNGEVVGDVDFASVSQVAGAITPVPGGVGPLTTLTILESTLAQAERRGSSFSQSAAD